MEYVIYLFVMGVVTLWQTIEAFRTRSEAHRLVAVLLATDYFASWVIQITTKPPLRPLLLAAMCVVFIIIVARHIHVFRGKAILRSAFVLGYLVMAMSSFFYLATEGVSPLLYYVVLNAIFLLLAGINIVLSKNGNGAIVGGIHDRGGAFDSAHIPDPVERR